MQKSKLGNDLDIPHDHVREKIFAWEVSIKSYKEAEIGKCKGRDRNSVEVEIECNQQIENLVKFMRGDLVLLSHSSIKLPPDKLKSWWY